MEASHRACGICHKDSSGFFSSTATGSDKKAGLKWEDIQMKGTYKAVEVSAPDMLRVVERPVSEPGAGQVRMRVEACGICHTDAATVTGIYPGLNLPRVPGHEVVGRIEALGSGVSRWKIGQ